MNPLNRFSKKYMNIKFVESPSSGSRIVLCGWRDGHERANSCFSQFMELLIPLGTEYSNVCSHRLISKSMNNVLPVVLYGC
jgi:hypothetical protein